MLNKLLLLGLTLVGAFCKSQNYPLFGPEKKVTINGLSFDAMEPFISLTGDTLFLIHSIPEEIPICITLQKLMTLHSITSD